MKFKVGDRVKVVKLTHGAPVETIGKIGIVDRSPGIFHDVRFSEKFDEYDTWSYVDNELTHVSNTAEPSSTLSTQVGGDHYTKLGDYQPWEVLKHWLTPEEFRGYMKGSAITYLARERDKGGDQDIEKAKHTLEGMIEAIQAGSVPPPRANSKEQSDG